MVTNITVYDLENYPDNNKTVTTDHKQLVPVGYEGDEQWVLSFTTTAFSDNTNSTAIQDIYVQEIKAGWIKSSGLVGTGGKFDITNSNKVLGIKMDASSGWYYITLDTGNNIGGDTIAADMEEKIRAIPDSALWNANDDSLAYLNASVEYTNGHFEIISGTVSSFYTGANRSSVKVTSSGADTLYKDLGFNLSVDSQTIAGTAINESLINSNYTVGGTTVSVSNLADVQAGDAVAITDGTNIDYFITQSGTSSSSLVVTSGVITNSYTSGEAKVQILKLQDPEQEPAPIYGDIDSITRWGIKSVVNQVDFSS